jgi:hypothetical protein
MKFPAFPFIPLLLCTGFFLCSCQTMDTSNGEGALDQAGFALIDMDGDGKVSLPEMAKYKHREGLAEVDTDDDKVISISEWNAAKPSDAANGGHFQQLDSNGDDRITEEEAVQYILTHSTFPDAFKAIDRDADGFLLWEEYSAGDPSTLDVTLNAPHSALE